MDLFPLWSHAVLFGFQVPPPGQGAGGVGSLLKEGFEAW